MPTCAIYQGKTQRPAFVRGAFMRGLFASPEGSADTGAGCDGVVGGVDLALVLGA